MKKKYVDRINLFSVRVALLENSVHQYGSNKKGKQLKCGVYDKAGDYIN